MDSAEIDPSVVAVDMKYFAVTNPAIGFWKARGLTSLTSNGQYNVIWVDDILTKKGPKAFVPASQLQTLQERLEDEGIIVANLGSGLNFTYFSEVVQDYRRGYSHAIRIKAPIFKTTESLDILSEAAFPGK